MQRSPWRKRYAQLGRLPLGLFVNGVTALEGALRFTSKLSANELQSIVVGTFDWDPFAAHLPFDVTMVRQNVEVMIAEGFALIDSFGVDRNALVVVPTSFGKMGELDGAQEDWDEGDVANLQKDTTSSKTFSNSLSKALDKSI